jgi:hypothetical protein
MKTLFVLMVLFFNIVLSKKRVVPCEIGSDCLNMNLSPKPRGCMSMAGAQPICFHYEGHKNSTRNYKYNFDE